MSTPFLPVPSGGNGHQRKPSVEYRTPSPSHLNVPSASETPHIPSAPRSQKLSRYNRGPSPAARVEGLAPFDFSEVDTHRGKFIDEWLLRQVRDKHITQVVVLAGGTSCARGQVDLPESVSVWEVDFPEAIQYKESLLSGDASRSTFHTKRHGTDMTKGGWLDDLRSIGLSTSLPVAWIVEGLLIYFNGDEVDALLDLLWHNSVRGSVLCCDFGLEVTAKRARKITKTFLSKAAHLRAFSRSPHAFMSGMGWDSKVYIYGETEKHYTTINPGGHISPTEVDTRTHTFPHFMVIAERRDTQSTSKRQRDLERKKQAAERVLAQLSAIVQPEVLQPLVDYVKAVDACNE